MTFDCYTSKNKRVEELGVKQVEFVKFLGDEKERKIKDPIQS